MIRSIAQMNELKVTESFVVLRRLLGELNVKKNYEIHPTSLQWRGFNQPFSGWDG